MDKYDLPPNDPRFLSRPFALHVQDFLQDLVVRKERLRLQLKHGEGDRDVIEESLRTIDRVLGIESGRSVTEWADEVERALEEGRVPDWDV